MALENEYKQPSFEVLCKIILTLNISADNVFYPENQYAENEKEQLRVCVFSFYRKQQTALAAVFPSALFLLKMAGLFKVSDSSLHRAA